MFYFDNEMEIKATSFNITEAAFFSRAGYASWGFSLSSV